MDLQVTFSIQLPMRLTKREKWYLASCPVLDVHSQGETKEAAKKNLGEAIQVFLISCFERGALDAVLKECGFKPLSASEVKSRTRNRNIISVPIPFSIPQPAEPSVCRA